MRLTIIPLVIPTAQEYQDLYKIWPDQTQSELAQMFQSGQLCYAARFNDRLLAAAKVTLNQHQGVISDFCVREVTRRRGVGLYLLQQICHDQPEINHWYFNFSELVAAQKNIMEQFLSAGGFSATTQTNRWEMKLGDLHEVK